MNDWGLSVLTRYPLNVRSTRKVRGALLCDTAQGTFLVQEYRGSEKRLLKEAQILKFLKDRGGYHVDAILADSEGKLINANEEGVRYVVKQWYLWQECSVGSRNELCQAVRLLAKLHLLLRQFPKGEGEDDIGIVSEVNLNSLYEKHSRELHRAYTYLRRRKKKTAMEAGILKSLPQMYGQAQSAMEHLKQSEYNNLIKAAAEQGWIYHGAYHQHNVLIGNGQIASVNYERFGIGLQICDLYQFMRKILEKHGWNQELGLLLLEEYERILPLTESENQVLYAMFEYPEKYWKQVNFYLNGSKTWISERSIEKMQAAAGQYEPRQEFLTALERHKIKG